MILTYTGTIMTTPDCLDNRVKLLRQARGWTQGELATAAGLSRTGVGAIESQRLVPSVAAALKLSRALGCSVEELFGAAAAASSGVEFAWQPVSFPCRYWAAEVAGRTLLFPVESSPAGPLLHDGVARHATDLPPAILAGHTTLVLATCDPAAGYLTELLRSQSGLRLLVFTRPSREALALVEQGVVHVAGVHLAGSDNRGGNAAALAKLPQAHALALLHVAQWQEGLATAPTTRLRSASAARRANLRWVGRSPAAGARRCQDELLGNRRAPRHIARDHRGVVEAIRSGWADVGVCLRLASEEGQLAFLPVAEESYDLCFRQDQAADPRLGALARAVRSHEYRRLLGELPGYRPQSQVGEIEHVV